MLRYKNDRFDNYRELTARRTEGTCSCGTPITAGMRIGWNSRLRKAKCAHCWDKWVAENRTADAIEAGILPQCW